MSSGPEDARDGSPAPEGETAQTPAGPSFDPPTGTPYALPPLDPAQDGTARSRDEAEWMPRAHWLGLLTHWVGPLLVLLTVGARSERVRAEAVESLNWEITVAIALAFSAMLTFVGVGLVAALVVVACSIVFHLRGAAEARQGRHYRYPLALRIVR